MEVQLHGCNETVYAFNEARIENMVNTLSLDLWINDEYFEKFLGSGICLCSQIGSTAINRSSADFMISSTLMAHAEYKPVVKDYTSYIKRTIK